MQNQEIKLPEFTLEKGETLILRCCRADGTSKNNFKWPSTGVVTAPDWRPTKVCGNGLHGWLRGEGDYGAWHSNSDDLWIVAAVMEERLIDLGQKVKFETCRIVYRGNVATATAIITSIYPGSACIRSTITGGDGSTITGGDGSTITGGDGSTITGGIRSTITGGCNGVIQIKEWDVKHERFRVVTGYVGEDGIEAGIPYQAKDGKLIPKPQNES